MAGAGYKLFATGDVLTAAEVNTYLMQQAVMVFDDSAARTTALSGVVAEGMLSYLKDTNAVEVYDGSGWVASDDPNAIQNSIVDAKGDLISASADNVPARLAVGNDGESIVADSSATTGLRWQGDYAAGKNKIINGDFAINQRAFSSTTTSITYGFDRWLMLGVDGTTTYSAQTFTAGAAPVAGYEATNFARLVTTGQTATNAFSFLSQKMEDVRTYANQTVTVSFWAKAATGTPKIAIELDQQFGSGGSTRVATAVSQPTISTSWARYSGSVSVPSISGKTIGSGNSLNLNLIVSAGSDFNARTGSLGIQSNTFDIWGVQVEAGSVATAFQTATGTLAGELAACQRYYYRSTASAYQYFCNSANTSTTAALGSFFFPVTMRTAPSFSASAANTFMVYHGATITAGTAIATDGQQPNVGGISLSVASGLTAGQASNIRANNTTAFLEYSAEL